MSQRVTDLHAVSQSRWVRRWGNRLRRILRFLPWLILCRLGGEQLGRAFHKYNTSMDASTQSALVGVCFRNLSACKQLEWLGYIKKQKKKKKKKKNFRDIKKCMVHIWYEQSPPTKLKMKISLWILLPYFCYIGRYAFLSLFSLIYCRDPVIQ